MKGDRATVAGRRAEQLLRKAVAKVIEENRKLGLPVAVMKDGKAVLISAETALAAVRESHATYSGRRK
jgi:DNA-directed RNA polymerase subunit K/omega